MLKAQMKESVCGINASYNRVTHMGVPGARAVGADYLARSPRSNIIGVYKSCHVFLLGPTRIDAVEHVSWKAFPLLILRMRFYQENQVSTRIIQAARESDPEKPLTLE